MKKAGDVHLVVEERRIVVWEEPSEIAMGCQEAGGGGPDSYPLAAVWE